MRHVTFGMCTVIVALGLAATVGAQAVPWKDDAANKGEKTVAPADLKAELEPAHYDRAVKPIEAKIAEAEKRLEYYNKEMEKPEEKRNLARAVGYREQAASFYIGAALAARRAMGLVKTDAQKEAIRQQFEEPNQQKAIEIFLDLAGTAYDRRDLRAAVGFYRRVLSLDAENAQAKDALTKIAKDLEEARKTTKGGTSKGGGSGEEEKSWEGDWKSTGRTDTDWSKIGRPTW